MPPTHQPEGGSLFSYVLRRMVGFFPTWIAVAFITFAIMYLIPGDPVVSILGPTASPEARQRMVHQLHLDEAFTPRFTAWMVDVAHGDLGESIFLDRPVLQAIGERANVTISLGLGAMFFALAIGLPLGVLAAVRPNTWLDLSVMVISLIGLSTPEFLLGLGLIYTFGVALQVMPIAGFVSFAQSPAQFVSHLVMPAFTLGFIHAALVARMTRANMIEILAEDYIRTARSKGLHERAVLFKHAVRLALIPVTTIIGFVTILIVAGAFITEIVFNLPGMGNLIVSAVLRRDYPLVQGAMLVVATGVLVFNLLVDVLYTFLDPRIRYD